MTGLTPRAVVACGVAFLCLALSLTAAETPQHTTAHPAAALHVRLVQDSGWGWGLMPFGVQHASLMGRVRGATHAASQASTYVPCQRCNRPCTSTNSTISLYRVLSSTLLPAAAAGTGTAARRDAKVRSAFSHNLRGQAHARTHAKLHVHDMFWAAFHIGTRPEQVRGCACFVSKGSAAGATLGYHLCTPGESSRRVPVAQLP